MFDPLRTSLSHWGGVRLLILLIVAVKPPVAVLPCSETTLDGVRKMMVLRESADSVSRIINAAFAQSEVPWTPVTRAMIMLSPVNDCRRNWNESAVPQISAPEPLTVAT